MSKLVIPVPGVSGESDFRSVPCRRSCCSRCWLVVEVDDVGSTIAGAPRHGDSDGQLRHLPKV